MTKKTNFTLFYLTSFLLIQRRVTGKKKNQLTGLAFIRVVKSVLDGVFHEGIVHRTCRIAIEEALFSTSSVYVHLFPLCLEKSHETVGPGLCVNLNIRKERFEVIDRR